MSKKIILPKDIDKLEKLSVKEEVLISGTLYTARDQAHKRIVKKLKKGEELPFNIQKNCIFYAGPSPKNPKTGAVAIGPTTSYRMDKYTPYLLSNGLKCVIGKGKRSKKVIMAFKKYNSTYLITVGGIAAYLSSKIINIEKFDFQDLGPEAVYKIEVKDFPCIVAVDSCGNDIYKMGG